jgi:hypothetical protein
MHRINEILREVSRGLIELKKRYEIYFFLLRFKARYRLTGK